MPRSGVRRCLPIGWPVASVRSSAQTINSCGPLPLSAPVTSTLKPSYPPRWVATWVPFTHTRAS
jgi:hypothetical protein